MTTLAAPTSVPPSTPLAPTLLGRALLADALASGACGLLLALAAGPLSGRFGLPVDLLRGAGLVLLPFAGFVLWLGRRTVPPRAAVIAVIALNALWVVESLMLLVGGFVAPTGLGVAFVLAQAALVAVLAELEFVGLRRRTR